MWRLSSVKRQEFLNPTDLTYYGLRTEKDGVCVDVSGDVRITHGLFIDDMTRQTRVVVSGNSGDLTLLPYYKLTSSVYNVISL